jgi:hypothetical protein
LPHHYRIDWSATQTDFFIDGLLVSTNTANPVTANMRPAISDVVPAFPALVVDWIRMTPYDSPCSFLSAVIDGGNAAANWTTLVANGLQPPGATYVLETRTGNVPVPNGTWSPFAAVGLLDAIASPNGRYLQYRATLTTTDPDQTAELQDVSVSYDACTPTGPEICDNGIDDDCDGVQTACTPTPTVTPVPPTHTATATATSTRTRTATATHRDGNSDRSGYADRHRHPDQHADQYAKPVRQQQRRRRRAVRRRNRETATAAARPATSSRTGPPAIVQHLHGRRTCNAFGRCRGFTACPDTRTCDFWLKCKVTAGVCKCGG